MGDYLYTDYTFGKTAGSYNDWIARCIAPASVETNNKSLWATKTVNDTWGTTGSDIANLPNITSES